MSPSDALQPDCLQLHAQANAVLVNEVYAPLAHDPCHLAESL